MLIFAEKIISVNEYLYVVIGVSAASLKWTLTEVQFFTLL